MSSYASGALGSRAHAKPILRYDRGLSARRRRDPRPGLADDPDFYMHGDTTSSHGDDDRELFTWPDAWDQTCLHRIASSPLWHDDAEEDDDDHGIDDLPQDAREEDGI